MIPKTPLATRFIKIKSRGRRIEALQILIDMPVFFLPAALAIVLLNQVKGIALEASTLFPALFLLYFLTCLVVFLTTAKPVTHYLIQAERKAGLKELLSTAYEYMGKNGNPFTPLLLHDASEKLLVFEVEKTFTLKKKRVHALFPLFILLIVPLSFLRLNLGLIPGSGPRQGLSDKRIVEWLTEAVALPVTDPDRESTVSLAMDLEAIQGEFKMKEMTEKERTRVMDEFRRAFNSLPPGMKRKIMERLLAGAKNAEEQALASGLMPSPGPDQPASTESRGLLAEGERDRKKSGADSGSGKDMAEGSAQAQSGGNETGKEPGSEGGTEKSAVVISANKKAFEPLTAEKEISLSSGTQVTEADIIRVLEGALPVGRNDSAAVAGFLKQARTRADAALSAGPIPANYRSLVRKYFLKVGLIKEVSP